MSDSPRAQSAQYPGNDQTTELTSDLAVSKVPLALIMPQVEPDYQHAIHAEKWPMERQRDQLRLLPGLTGS